MHTCILIELMIVIYTGWFFMPACDRRAVGGVAKGELSPECDRTMFCVFLSRTCVMSVSFMLFIWALTSVYLSLAVVSCVCVLIQDFCLCVCVCVCVLYPFVTLCVMCLCVCAYTYMHMLVYAYQVNVVWVTVRMFTCQLTCGVYVQIVTG